MKKRTIVIGSAAAAGVLLIGGVAAVNATGQPGFLAGEDDEALSGSTLDRASEAALAETGGGEVTDSERSDDRGDATYEIEVTRDNGEQLDVYLDSHYNVVNVEHDDPEGGYDDRDDDGADDRDDNSDTLDGSAFDKASKAAMNAAGGGKVVDAERSDDRGAAYEVTVLLDNGDDVDVYLDSDFAVVGKDYDHNDGDDD